MDDINRFFKKREIDWQNLRRLHARYVYCTKCPETDPRCFIGELVHKRREGEILYALCENCKRKMLALTETLSTEDKWTALRKAGVMNTRCHCGEDNPFTFEADHIAGHKSSDAVVGVCINCHLKRTSVQLTEYPPDNCDEKHPLIVARNTIRGILEHQELMTSHLRSVEESLHKLAIQDSDPPQE